MQGFAPVVSKRSSGCRLEEKNRDVGRAIEGSACLFRRIQAFAGMTRDCFGLLRERREMEPGNYERLFSPQ
jgi:hypothetical protein